MNRTRPQQRSTHDMSDSRTASANPRRVPGDARTEPHGVAGGAVMGTRPHNVYLRSNNAHRTRCPEANAYGHVYDRDDAYVTLLVVDRDHECSWRDVGRSIGTV